MIVRGATVVTPYGLLDAHEVVVEGDRITGVRAETGPEAAAEPGSDVVQLDGGWLVPGFVDLHCHGGGGADFAVEDPEEQARAAAFHTAHGTTAMLDSLVTAPVEALCRQLASLATLVESGTSAVVGSHLEGPFLAESRCGAHNPAHLVDPDLDAFAAMVEAARRTLRMITLAPELPGALELVDAARAAGVVVSVGHTDATYAQATAAFGRGASAATHLFNGMRGIHHREPGPVLASLDAGAACEVIADLVHVHPGVLSLVTGRSPELLVLVTDAMAATGLPDGTYALGGLDVAVADSVARLTSNGALAGSTLTMDLALRNAVQTAGLSLAHAVAGASANPARALGLDRGRIGPGAVADLVHLGPDLAVRGVLRAGGLVEAQDQGQAATGAAAWSLPARLAR